MTERWWYATVFQGSSKKDSPSIKMFFCAKNAHSRSHDLSTGCHFSPNQCFHLQFRASVVYWALTCTFRAKKTEQVIVGVVVCRGATQDVRQILGPYCQEEDGDDVPIPDVAQGQLSLRNPPHAESGRTPHAETPNSKPKSHHSNTPRPHWPHEVNRG